MSLRLSAEHPCLALSFDPIGSLLGLHYAPRGLELVPDPCAAAKGLGEADGALGGHAGAALDDFGEPMATDAQGLGSRCDRQAERLDAVVERILA